MTKKISKQEVFMSIAVVVAGAGLLAYSHRDDPERSPASFASAVTAEPTAVPAPSPSRSSTAPADRLVLPPGRKMTPAKWCSTYAPTFTRLAGQADRIPPLRRLKYKNGEPLDNSKRNAQADALYRTVTAYDPGPAIADALVSLPYRTKREAALAAPDGASKDQVNVDMWYAYEDVGRAQMRYTQKFDDTLLAPDDDADAHDMARELLTRAIGTPPTGEPGSGDTGLCYVQKPYPNAGGSGSGSIGGGSGTSGGCSYRGRPRATWKVWRWGDWSC